MKSSRAAKLRMLAVSEWALSVVLMSCFLWAIAPTFTDPASARIEILRHGSTLFRLAFFALFAGLVVVAQLAITSMRERICELILVAQRSSSRSSLLRLRLASSKGRFVQVLMFNCFLMFVVTTIAVIAPYGSYMRSMSGPAKSLVFVLLVILVLAFVMALQSVQERVARRVREGHQLSRDARAMELASKSDEWPFALYLRPFSSGQRLECYFAADLMVSEYDGAIARDAEEFFAEVMEDVFPLVGFGMAEGEIGSGRVSTVGQAWKTYVETLALKAQFILCYPADTPGTLWELEMLRSKNLLSKTVFFTPSRRPRPMGLASKLSEGEAATWPQRRERLRKLGYDMPTAESDDIDLFVLTSGGEATLAQGRVRWNDWWQSRFECWAEVERLLRAGNPEINLLARARSASGLRGS